MSSILRDRHSKAWARSIYER